MLTNYKDRTIERERIKKFKYLINEYELIKNKKHTQYMFVTDFYKFHNIKRQTFIKYYNRYKQRLTEKTLLPERRGPKWKTRRPIPFVERKVVELRGKGNNRYEISDILKPILKKSTPSASGVYQILKRYNVNRMTAVMKKNKREIIKKKAGELGHIDCHYISANQFEKENKSWYIVSVLDDCTRLVWLEVVEDIKSLTVMFATLRCLNMLNNEYKIKFERIISDNGAEFGSGKKAKNKETNPFERLLQEMNIKHSYTKPYRPQTNGKVERFWRTLKADLLEDTVFSDINNFKKELLDYLIYYNEHRQHQALNLKTPVEFNNFCQRIT